MRRIHEAGKQIQSFFRWLILGLTILSTSLFGLVPINAQSTNTVTNNNQPEDVKIARISLIQYYVAMMRGDDPDWFDATVNMPVQTGDRLYVGDSGLSELQIGSNFFVRLSANTGLDILDLSKERSQLRMYSGSLVVNLRMQPTQSVEIDTPTAAVTLTDAGEYRINVLSDKTAEVIVWSGNAEVYNGNQVLVRAGQRMTLEAGDTTSYDISQVPKQDDWDVWNQQRDQQLAQEAESLNDIPDSQYVEGAEDLSANGEWINTSDYGEVWTPDDVSDDWAPYQNGGWIWRDPCGWTWVSTESWGWAPYHYGTWTYISGRWCWVPGSGGQYSPAQVGFINGPKGTIGWVPLGPGDKPNRRGTAMNGSGVPYTNQGVRNAISTATRDGFGGGKLTHNNPLIARKGDATGTPISNPQITPTKNSLTPVQDGRTIFGRTTPSYFNRTVVARNNNVPVVRPFADQLTEIKAKGGAAVPAVQTTSTGAVQTRTLTPQVNAANRQTGFVNSGQQPSGLVRRAVTVESTQPSQDIGQSNGNSYRQSTETSQSQGNAQSSQRTVPQQNGVQESQQTARPSIGTVYHPPTVTARPQRNVQDTQVNNQQQEQQRLQQQQQNQEQQRAQEQQEQERQRVQRQQQDEERQRAQQQQDQERQNQQQQEQEQQRQSQVRQQRQQEVENQRQAQEQQRQQQQEQQRQSQDQQRQQQEEQQRQAQEQQRQEQQRQQQVEQQRQAQEQQRQQQEEQQRQAQEQQRQQQEQQRQAEQQRQQQEQQRQAEQQRQQQEQQRQAEQQRQQQEEQQRQAQEQQRQQQEQQQRQQQEQQRQQQEQQRQQEEQQRQQQQKKPGGNL